MEDRSQTALWTVRNYAETAYCARSLSGSGSRRRQSDQIGMNCVVIWQSRHCIRRWQGLPEHHFEHRSLRKIQGFSIPMAPHLAENLGFARLRPTLETPDHDPTEADSDVMGVAGQAPAAVTGCLMPELKAQGEDEREHPFDKGLTVVKQLNRGRFIVEIHSDGTVVPRSCGSCAHVSLPGQQVSSPHETPCR
jgi:hypothetical protein